MKKWLSFFCLSNLAFLLLLAETAHSEQFYLPPSIYRTLSTRHRSYFSQPAFKEIEISAHVAFTAGLNQTVTLHYGATFGMLNSMPMDINGRNEWQATIPTEDVNAAKIYYWLEVWDGVNSGTAPENNPEDNPFKIDIDFAFDEKAPPHIELMPRSKELGSLAQCKKENMLISAYVVDNAEPYVDAVRVIYRIDQNENDLFGDMESKSDYLWNILIPKEALSNFLRFRILASSSAPPDTTVWPPMDSSRFAIQTNSQQCRVVPPYVRLTQESLNLTWAEGGAPQPFQKEIKIDALVTTATPVAKRSVNLYFQPRFMTDYAKTSFAQTSNDSIWTATIPTAAVVDSTIKFYVEFVQGKDEVTAPIWKERLRYYNIPVTPPNAPPIIKRTTETIALSDSSQQAGRTIPIKAVITDSLGPSVSSAALYYRQRGAQTFTFAEMHVVADSLWRADIPAADVQIGFIEYYLWATDDEDTTFAPNRPASPDSVYVIEIKNLNAPPIITLTDETIGLGTAPQPSFTSIPISAFIVDTLGPGVQSAALYVRHDDGFYPPLMMDNVADSTWRAEIPAEAVLPDSVFYYISATDGDSSGYAPDKQTPIDSSFVISINLVNEPPVIIHDPVVRTVADSAILISAIVIDTTRIVDSVQLYYRNVKHRGEMQILAMTLFSGDEYRATIPAGDVVVPFIEYYIWADDDFGAPSRTGNYNILIYPPESVLPNPFTPNNDGYNDYVTFHISGLQNGGGTVIIYNRRGRAVRTLYGGEPWYGRNDSGGDLPPDVYLYAVTVDGTLQASGTLTLIR